MKKFLGLFLIIFVFASTASADNAWRRGSETDLAAVRSATCSVTLQPGQTCYHTYNDADTNSAVILVRTTATLCLNPDIATAGAATATIKLWRALTDSRTIDANNWMEILSGQILNGNYLATPQTACILLIDPGVYYVESVTAPGAQDVVVSFTSH